MSKDKQTGFTRKTNDLLGGEKEEHFDSTGKKIGETRFTKDFLGFTKQEHFNSQNEKTGETRRGADLLGTDRAEHFNSEGKRTGYSENSTDFLQDPIQKHCDPKGNIVGSSKLRANGLGQIRKEHSGTFYKSAEASQIPSAGIGGSTYSTDGYGYSHSSPSESYFPSQHGGTTGRVRLRQFAGAIYWWLCIGLWGLYLYASVEYGGPPRAINGGLAKLHDLTVATNDPVFNFIIYALLLVSGLILAPGMLVVGFYLMLVTLAVALPLILLRAFIVGLIALAQISGTGAIIAVALGALTIWGVISLIRIGTPSLGRVIRRGLDILFAGLV